MDSFVDKNKKACNKTVVHGKLLFDISWGKNDLMFEPMLYVERISSWSADDATIFNALAF